MIFYELEHLTHVSWVIQAALMAGFVLVVAGLMVRRSVAAADGGVLPDEGVSIRNVVEVLVEWLAGMARDHMGPDWRRYFPIVGTMFFFILVANLMGLVPGLAGATSDVNTTAAWAVIAWLLYTWIGVTTHKHKYVNKFLGPAFGEKHIRTGARPSSSSSRCRWTSRACSPWRCACSRTCSPTTPWWASG